MRALPTKVAEASMTLLPIKLVQMNGLQARVKDLGVCPFCHTKTLKERYDNGWVRAEQCSTCLSVYTSETRVTRS